LSGRPVKSPGLQGSLTSISSPNVLVVDVESAEVTKTGSWTVVSDVDAVGSSYRESAVTDDVLSFSFGGSALWIRFKLGPDCGKATVTIDGTAMEVDLYNALDAYKYVSVGVGLDETATHTVTIKVEGTKNPSSSDYKVKVDAYTYRLTEEALSLHSIEYLDLINVINTINKISQITNIDTLANLTTVGTINDVKLIDQISQINPSDPFSQTDILVLDAGEYPIYWQAAIFGSYLYLPLSTDPGKIVKVNYSAFSKTSTLTLSSPYLNVTSLVVSGGYLYAGTSTSPGYIVKVDLSTFTVVSTLTLPIGKDYVQALAVSGGYLYVGTSTIPGYIVKVDLSTFTVVSTLALGVGEEYVQALAVSGGYLYAGTVATPGCIVKVDLSTFTKVSTLTLPSGEYIVQTLIVPDIGDYLYAGLQTSPGHIVKIDLLGANVRISRIDTIGAIGTIGTIGTIAGSLPAGTNTIGKLAANSGVDIGDVDVLTLPSVTQATRTSLTMKPEREDLLLKDLDFAANASLQEYLAAVANQKHKVYAFGYEADADGVYYFSATVNGSAFKFGRRITKGVYAQTLVHPVVCDVNTALQFMSTTGNSKVWLQYKTEA